MLKQFTYNGCKVSQDLIFYCFDFFRLRYCARPFKFQSCIRHLLYLPLKWLKKSYERLTHHYCNYCPHAHTHTLKVKLIPENGYFCLDVQHCKARQIRIGNQLILSTPGKEYVYTSTCTYTCAPNILQKVISRAWCLQNPMILHHPLLVRKL